MESPFKEEYNKLMKSTKLSDNIEKKGGWSESKHLHQAYSDFSSKKELLDFLKRIGEDFK